MTLIEEMIMLNAEVSANVGICILKNTGHLPFPEDLRMAAEKYLIDEPVGRVAMDEDEDEEEVIIQKPSTRAIRRKKTAHARRRLAKKSEYSADFINPVTGKIKNTGYREYERGAKVYDRKRLHIPEYEDEKPRVGGIIRIWEPPIDLEEYSSSPLKTCIWDVLPNCFLIEDEEDEEPSPVGIRREEDKDYQIHILKTQLEEKLRELHDMYSFLDEYNLRTLYEDFLQKNNIEFF